jgi:hypothetical protein
MSPLSVMKVGVFAATCGVMLAISQPDSMAQTVAMTKVPVSAVAGVSVPVDSQSTYLVLPAGCVSALCGDTIDVRSIATNGPAAAARVQARLSTPSSPVAIDFTSSQLVNRALSLSRRQDSDASLTILVSRQKIHGSGILTPSSLNRPAASHPGGTVQANAASALHASYISDSATARWSLGDPLPGLTDILSYTAKMSVQFWSYGSLVKSLQSQQMSWPQSGGAECSTPPPSAFSVKLYSLVKSSAIKTCGWVDNPARGSAGWMYAKSSLTNSLTQSASLCVISCTVPLPSHAWSQWMQWNVSAQGGAYFYWG